jgi:Family of unknown function (DUF5996)
MTAGDPVRPLVAPPVTADPTATAGWPSLPVAQWRPTRDTLHLWTQVVGKIRLANTPLINHWWNVPLYQAAAEHAGWERSALERRPRW